MAEKQLVQLNMARLCDNCGKGIMYGNLVSHAKNRTKRVFKPNLHKKTVVFNGKKMNAKLCTKCIKLFKKAEMALKEQRESTINLTVTA